MSAIFSALDLADAQSLFDPLADLSVQMAIIEHRRKPTIHPITGVWVTRRADITKDASGRIVAERLGEVR